MPSIVEKHCCYLFGTFVWVVGFLVYVAAFALPTWQRTSNSNTGEVYYEGLWQHTCTGLATDCQPYPVIVDEPFLEASRSMACVALAFYSMSALLFFIHNCTAYGRTVQTENKIVSYLPFSSGLLGVAACVLYLTTIERSTDQSAIPGWGLVMACVTNCCCCFGGVCMMAGSCMDRRRVERETQVHQSRTILSRQASSSHPMELMSASEFQDSPIWTLPTSSTSHSNPPLAFVAVPVSMLTQSSPRVTRSSTADQELATDTCMSVPDVSSHTDIGRTAPSAPPPEYFYY